MLMSVHWNNPNVSSWLRSADRGSICKRCSSGRRTPQCRQALCLDSTQEVLLAQLSESVLYRFIT